MDGGETNRQTDPALTGVRDEPATWGGHGAPMGQTIGPRDALIAALAVLAFVAWIWLLVWSF